MRLPWDRSKPPQLDLLGPEEPAPMAETPVKAPIAEAQAPVQEVPPMPVVESLPTPTGEPLLVPLSALCEDPANPRTEFPQAELQELAEDTRRSPQRGSRALSDASNASFDGAVATPSRRHGP